MAKGFQCDKCEKMFVGEPVRELKMGDFEAVYHGVGDICRQCYIKGFQDAVRNDTSNRIAVQRRSQVSSS